MSSATGMRTPVLLVPCLAVCLAAAGCSVSPARPSPAEEHAGVPVQLTPFPYNSDVFGNDLPVEIGRFGVPAAPDADGMPQLQLGFVRYPANEGVTGPPVVFLTDRSPDTAELTLYATLRAAGDIVVFSRRGYGFSSPPPPCPERLSYPLDEPLTIEKLSGLTREFSRKCLDHLQRQGFVPAAFDSERVASDFPALSRAIGAGRLVLVAADEMTAPAIAALVQHPELFSRAVLINPRTSESVTAEALTAYFRRLDSPAGLTMADSIESMAKRLREAPQRVTVSSRSGRDVTLAIGELDLAFLCAHAAYRGGDDLQELGRALHEAAAGDFGRLGRLTLELRQALGLPDSISILRSAGTLQATARHDPSALDYALAWPRLVPDRMPLGTNPSPLPVRARLLIVREPGSPSPRGEVERLFPNHRSVELSPATSEPLDRGRALAQIMLDFLQE